MKYIDLLTEGGVLTGEISFYCRMLHISRQGFYKYLGCKGRPWKYEPLANAMMDILTEDECNDTYGRERMYDALIQARSEGVHNPRRQRPPGGIDPGTFGRSQNSKRAHGLPDHGYPWNQPYAQMQA